MKRKLAVVVVALVTVLTGCGTGGGATGSNPEIPGTTVGEDLPHDDARGISELAATELPETAGTGEISDSRVDAVPELPVLLDATELAATPDLAEVSQNEVFEAGDFKETTPGTALTGEPCTDDADCAVGVCAGTVYGSFCVPHCDFQWAGTGCEFDGWFCLESPAGGVCVPDSPPMCKACKNTSCPPSWCINMGWEGEFCLRPCIEDDDCPASSTCQAQAPGGPLLCTPEIASCKCTSQQVDSLVLCTVSNEFGTCDGVGSCTAEYGLIECNAHVPAPDLCDGEDNDCDGLTDEDFPKKGGSCDTDDEDNCPLGQYTCSADGLELVCSGDSPLVDKCDGQDNDCDGFIDEDFPNKGKVCGFSPLCGIGHFECSVDGKKLVCAGVWPAKEKCDGKDNDCDGATDEDYADLNGNGVADCLD